MKHLSTASLLLALLLTALAHAPAEAQPIRDGVFLRVLHNQQDSLSAGGSRVELPDGYAINGEQFAKRFSAYRFSSLITRAEFLQLFNIAPAGRGSGDVTFLETEYDKQSTRAERQEWLRKLFDLLSLLDQDGSLVELGRKAQRKYARPALIRQAIEGF